MHLICISFFCKQLLKFINTLLHLPILSIKLVSLTSSWFHSLEISDNFTLSTLLSSFFLIPRQLCSECSISRMIQNDLSGLASCQCLSYKTHIRLIHDFICSESSILFLLGRSVWSQYILVDPLVYKNSSYFQSEKTIIHVMNIFEYCVGWVGVSSNVMLFCSIFQWPRSKESATFKVWLLSITWLFTSNLAMEKEKRSRKLCYEFCV